MPWTWVRPEDPSVLVGDRLLDLGVGDGMTLETLNPPAGLVVGVDRSAASLAAAALRTRHLLVAAEADHLSFSPASFDVVLAADLFHHLPEEALLETLGEVARVLRPGGRLVAWWYERPGRKDVDGPRFPRPLDPVLRAVGETGFTEVKNLPLRVAAGAAPTVGLAARR